MNSLARCRSRSGWRARRLACRRTAALQVGRPGRKVQYSRPAAAGRQKAEKVTSSRVSSVGSGGAAGAASGDAAKASAPKTAAEQEQAYPPAQDGRRGEGEEGREGRPGATGSRPRTTARRARRELAACRSGQRVARLNDAGRALLPRRCAARGGKTQRDVAASHVSQLGCKLERLSAARPRARRRRRASFGIRRAAGGRISTRSPSARR